MTKDSIEIVPNDSYDVTKSSLALYTKLHEGFVKITQRNTTNNLMAKEAIDLILEDWTFPEDTSLEFNLACLTHWFYKHDTESLKHIDLLQSLRNEGIHLRLKPRTVVNEKVTLVNLGPKEPSAETPDDYKGDGVLLLKLSDEEEEAFTRIMAMVEEKNQECTSDPLRAAAKEGSPAKKYCGPFTLKSAAKITRQLQKSLDENVRKVEAQALLDDIRNKLYSEVYTEILNRATELQEQNTTGDLVPELNGLIEALSIVQSLKNSNNHNNSDTNNI